MQRALSHGCSTLGYGVYGAVVVVGDRNGPCERCSQSDPQPLHPCQRAGRELLPRPRRPAARRAGNAVQEPRPRPCKARSTRRPSRVPSSSRGSVRVGHRSRGSRRQDTIRQGHQPDHQIRVLALRRPEFRRVQSSPQVGPSIETHQPTGTGRWARRDVEQCLASSAGSSPGLPQASHGPSTGSVVGDPFR